jgi:hypothetical protein
MGIVTDKYRGSKEYALVYCELITAARYRGKVTYQHIADLMGLPLRGNYMGREVSQVLSEISEDEVNNGRPMLSAVVTNIERTPGSGFYEVATQMGRFNGSTEEERVAFWQEERERVYAAWKREFRAE